MHIIQTIIWDSKNSVILNREIFISLGDSAKVHLAGSPHYWIQVWRAQKGSSRIGADKDLTRADWLVQRAISGSSPNASSADLSRLKKAQLLIVSR